MTEHDKTNIERLADRIARALSLGDRFFMLEGAELDWVCDLIRQTLKKERTR